MAQGLRRNYLAGVNLVDEYLASAASIPSNKGFIVDSDGTVNITPDGEGAVAVGLPVLRGIVYPVSLRAWNQAASVPALMKLYVLRQEIT